MNTDKEKDLETVEGTTEIEKEKEVETKEEEKDKEKDLETVEGTKSNGDVADPTEEKKVEDTDEYKTLKSELDSLKREIKKEKVKSAIDKISIENNINDKQRAYIDKLINFEEMLDDTGKVNIEKITEEIKNFADVCIINNNKTQLGYKGTDNNKQATDPKHNNAKSEAEKQLRAAFGLD